MGPEIHLAHLVGKLTVNQTAFVLAEIVDTSLVVVAIRVFFAPTLKRMRNFKCCNQKYVNKGVHFSNLWVLEW